MTSNRSVSVIIPRPTRQFSHRLPRDQGCTRLVVLLRLSLSLVSPRRQQQLDTLPSTDTLNNRPRHASLWKCHSQNSRRGYHWCRVSRLIRPEPELPCSLNMYSSGIGLACAHRYAKEGMSLFLVDISQSALEKAEQELKAVNGVGEVHSMLVDVGDVKQVLALRDRVLDVFGEVGWHFPHSWMQRDRKAFRCTRLTTQIHVLQNNAGTSRPTPAYSLDKSIEELQADWDYVMNTNFRGIMNVAQAFAPHMVRQENSSVIINTGSKQGITCPPWVLSWFRSDHH